MGCEVAAFYKFFELTELPALRAALLGITRAAGLRGTVLLAPEGVNATVAGPPEGVVRLIEAIETRVGALEIKRSRCDSLPFGRMRVRLKREIITMGCPEVRPALRTGNRLSPQQLKRWLDEGRELRLLDTRNDFEVESGTFQGAQRLGLARFGQFPEKLAALSKDGAPIVMFCTGGIRCEKATALALQYGFTDVYQLDGGILRYFEECGDAHFQGSCFVFDERQSLDAALMPTPVTGKT